MRGGGEWGLSDSFPVASNGTGSERVSRLVVSDSHDPMDCSPPGSSVHGIFQARILERVAISYSRFLTVYGYNCSISLFVIVVSILLCLICKLNVIIGTHVLENILGFSIV